jgi:hypothetical protein
MTLNSFQKRLVWKGQTHVFGTDTVRQRLTTNKVCLHHVQKSPCFPDPTFLGVGPDEEPDGVPREFCVIVGQLIAQNLGVHHTCRNKRCGMSCEFIGTPCASSGDSRLILLRQPVVCPAQQYTSPVSDVATKGGRQAGLRAPA